MRIWRTILITILSCTAIFMPAQTQPANDIFSYAAFNVWRTQNPMRDVGLANFERFLRNEKVLDTIPTYQILRTASMAGECNQSAFALPPQKYWGNIAGTLKFIKIHIIPNIGRVDAVSGYRNPVLNQCAQGARGSAHASYFALDLIPQSKITRKELTKIICKIHNEQGAAFKVGLGFYSRTRFHIDSRSYRRWGPDGRSNTSPCGKLIMPKPTAAH